MLTFGDEVHADQLAHVKKGCLERLRDDVAADGSRIEGSHKGWNSIMRSFASGLEVFTALGHDFVLRRNVRIAFAHAASISGKPDTFIRSTHASHHIRLVNYANAFWNSLTSKEKNPPSSPNLRLLPTLPVIASAETFGLVTSEYATTFGGLIVMKDEPEIEDTDLFKAAIEINPEDEYDSAAVMRDLNIDPALLSIPAALPHSQAIIGVSDAVELWSNMPGLFPPLSGPEKATDCKATTTVTIVSFSAFQITVYFTSTYGMCTCIGFDG